MRFTVVALSAMLLAGCQTKTVEEMSYTERKGLAAQITKRCYDQGVKPGSPEYEACSKVEVEREVATRRRQAARQDAAFAADRGPTTCQGFGATTVCY